MVSSVKQSAQISEKGIFVTKLYKIAVRNTITIILYCYGNESNNYEKCLCRNYHTKFMSVKLDNA